MSSFRIVDGCYAEAAGAVEGAAHATRAAVARWQARHTYMNFAETRREAKSLFNEQAYHRPRRVKAAYNPEDLMRSNHPIA